MIERKLIETKDTLQTKIKKLLTENKNLKQQQGKTKEISLPFWQTNSASIEEKTEHSDGFWYCPSI